MKPPAAPDELAKATYSEIANAERRESCGKRGVGKRLHEFEVTVVHIHFIADIAPRPCWRQERAPVRG